MNDKKFNINDWSIETPTGWKKFKGVKKYSKKTLYSVTTEKNKNVVIHLLKQNNDLYIHHLVSGIILGNYKFDLLKSSKNTKSSKKQHIYFYHHKKKFLHHHSRH